ncbi:hypothetical protein K502DRAFT_362634 [Neoconidiobolus thromboides FSU 785]|nr:hypothetical protein K502DRAFT_362634 [Neoconidiobolus thromboides FSU 785]
MENKLAPAKLSRLPPNEKSHALSSLFKLPNPFSKSSNNLLAKKEKEESFKIIRNSRHDRKKSMEANYKLNPNSAYSQPLQHSQQCHQSKEVENKLFKPMKLSPNNGLSPLDAIKLRAEMELQKEKYHANKTVLNSVIDTNETEYGLDLTWAKELENITQELNQFEVQIGVDKRKSIAHFCSTASPTPPFSQPNIKYNKNAHLKPEQAQIRPSIKLQHSNNNSISNISSSPINFHRYSNYLPRSSNNLILNENNMSPPPKIKNARSNPNFKEKIEFSIVTPMSSIEASPASNLQMPSFTSNTTITSSSSSSSSFNLVGKMESVESLKRELAWEKRSRMTLENQLLKEKEKNHMLQEEVRYLKNLVNKK